MSNLSFQRNVIWGIKKSQGKRSVVLGVRYKGYAVLYENLAHGDGVVVVEKSVAQLIPWNKL